MQEDMVTARRSPTEYKASLSQSESDGLSEWGNHSGKPSDSDFLERPAAACRLYTHLHW